MQTLISGVVGAFVGGGLIYLKMRKAAQKQESRISSKIGASKLAPGLNHASRTGDDETIEVQFIRDYVVFGLQINFRAILPLYERALRVEGLERKSLCASGLQLMYSSWEDYSLLLHAVRRRQQQGKFLHNTLGADNEAQEGSTFVPKIFKGHRSLEQTLNNLGFSSLTPSYLEKYRISITEEELDKSLQEFADSIRLLGEYQSKFNEVKNRLKHGKAVLGDWEEAAKRDFISHLTWQRQHESWELTIRHNEASLEQLKVATIHIAKLLIRSLDLLMFYMIQYYPSQSEDLPELVHGEGIDCARRVRDSGIESQGLTTILDE